MTSWEFPASDPVDLRVRIPAGRVTVRAPATQTATVTLETGRLGGRAERFLDDTQVEFDQGALSVIAPDRFGIGRGRGPAVPRGGAGAPAPWTSTPRAVTSAPTWSTAWPGPPRLPATCTSPGRSRPTCRARRAR